MVTRHICSVWQPYVSLEGATSQYGSARHRPLALLLAIEGFLTLEMEIGI